MYHVLYVDDEPILLEIGKLFLEKSCQFHVDTVTSAPEALQILKSTSYDAIVSDYQMPSMDGIALLKAIRTEFPDLPFIIFTGKGREDIVIEAFDNGADFYLQKGGQPTPQFLELGHKITAAVRRRQAEKALKDSEQRYRNIIEDQTEFICRFRPDGTHVFVNEAYCRYFNKTREEIMGHNFRPELFPEDQTHLKKMFASLSPENPVGFIRQRVIFPDRSIRWQRWVDRAIYDESGTLVEYQSVGRDITDIKTAELALAESERRYRNVVEDQTEFICRFKPDGIHNFVNDAYCRYFGIPREEIIGHKFIPKIPKEDKELIRSHFTSLTREHPVGTVEHRIVMPDGEIRWQQWSDRAIFNEDGMIIEFQSVGRDITDRKKMEETLKQSEHRFSDIIDNLPDATFVIDPDGKVIAWNKAIEEMTGVKARDMIGKNNFEYAIPFYGKRRLILIDLIFKSDEEIAQNYSGIIREKQNVLIAKTTLPHPKGKKSILWAKASPLYDDKGNIVGAIESIRDITESGES
jgi:PAS domain S-box-containing protein